MKDIKGIFKPEYRVAGRKQCWIKEIGRGQGGPEVLSQ